MKSVNSTTGFNTVEIRIKAMIRVPPKFATIYRYDRTVSQIFLGFLYGMILFFKASLPGFPHRFANTIGFGTGLLKAEYDKTEVGVGGGGGGWGGPSHEIKQRGA